MSQSVRQSVSHYHTLLPTEHITQRIAYAKDQSVSQSVITTLLPTEHMDHGNENPKGDYLQRVFGTVVAH